MCETKIEKLIHYCIISKIFSKVGHIYRSRDLPKAYSYPGGIKETIACNNRRAAETWLDAYKVLHDMTLTKEKLDLGTLPTRN